MSADCAIRETDGRVARFFGAALRSELPRICLVPVFVLACYQFEWTGLRSIVTSAFIYAASWFGIPAARYAFDSFSCNGEHYQFVISCTALDAFFGSIPLVWKRFVPFYRNLIFLAAYFILLSVINLFRLEIGFVIFLRGISWSLAHEVMAGVFYFALFLWIVRRRGWDRSFRGSYYRHSA